MEETNEHSRQDCIQALLTDGFQQNSFTRSNTNLDEIKALATKIIRNPQDTLGKVANLKAAALSKSPQCVFCDSTLTSKSGKLAGYDGECAKKYGMPWGAAINPEQSTLASRRSLADAEQALSRARSEELEKACARLQKFLEEHEEKYEEWKLLLSLGGRKGYWAAILLGQLDEEERKHATLQTHICRPMWPQVVKKAIEHVFYYTTNKRAHAHTIHYLLLEKLRQLLKDEHGVVMTTARVQSVTNR